MLSKRETAERLGVSVSTLERIAARGEIGYYRVGAALKFDEADIAAYKARVRVAPAPRVSQNPQPLPMPPQAAQPAVKRGPGRPHRKPADRTYYPGMKVV